MHTIYTSMLDEQITRSNHLMDRLRQVESNLTSAMEDEHRARHDLQELEQQLQIREAEVIVSAELEARAKKGPLAGLAKTSAAYKHAIDLLLDQAHSTELYDLWQRVQSARARYQDARMRREQLAITFSATKKSAELQAAILEAISTT